MVNPIKPKKYLNLQDTLKQKVVRIHNNYFDGVLTTFGDGNVSVVYPQTYPPSDTQNWIIYPVGDGIYMFAHISTGTILTQDITNSQLGAIDYNGSTTQQFTLETSKDNMNNYYIRNFDSGLQLQVANNYKLVATNEDLGDGGNWFIEVIKDIDISDELPSTEILNPFPKFTDSPSLLPSTTPDQLISYTLLPAPIIQDGELTLKQKLQISPYYIMEKHQYWTKLQQLTVAKGQRTSKQYTYGMDQNDQNDMTQTTGISVHEDSGFHFSLFGIFGGNASIKKTITDNLVIHESQSIKVSESTTKTSEFNNSNNQYDITYAKYILTTRLVVKRFSAMNPNIAIGDWSFSDQNMIRTTSFIPAPKTDCQDCYDNVDCSKCPDCPQCTDE
ncbi:RICIN domain-containing protein [Bacillus thuringiensis]